MHTITVKPMGDSNWAVDYTGALNSQIVRSGAMAEKLARHLAQTLAKAGQVAEILVYLRDGSLAGRFVATP